ncbi:hypothetical protein NFI96_000634 [Prochilodus magdalenae]|nr:hypothetical protein NFI96_000634 [Prochilodus magdalenae]
MQDYRWRDRKVNPSSGHLLSKQTAHETKPDQKQVRTQPTGAIFALQDFFELSDWEMFREAATSENKVNPRKALGTDSILNRALRECAKQLADVLTEIFNISLSTAVVPMFFKSATIIPVLKKSPVSCLNDYNPIALTPIIMKCFKRLIMRHITDQLSPSLDPLQLHMVRLLKR